MLDWNSIEYNRERHQDFVREAQRDRLAAEVVAAKASDETAQPVTVRRKTSPLHRLRRYLAAWRKAPRLTHRRLHY